ncbi:hypothetical protein BZG36_00258 [Bifiguratus adelaidae]|uniref:Uncharacterized protein n=1 Tax=Bifiguratus adelaidae TaxID=1938954 RepID=A0A261Y876_9FUNG|nr:hypothetical protein BZG36_00258 [Bifiguratus adelaidae]
MFNKCLQVALLALFFCVAAVIAQDLPDADLPLFPEVADVEISASFPNNPLQHVVNGERNKMVVSVTNNEKLPVTVNYIYGAFVDADDFGKIVRNLTVFKYDKQIEHNQTVDINYLFYSEFAPQEMGMTIVVDLSDSNSNKFNAIGFNGTVSIVEPQASIFDIQLLFLYVMLAGALGGIGYMIYRAFLGGSSKKTKKTKKMVTEPTEKAPLVDSQGNPVNYDEAWIPQHHLKPKGSTSNANVKKRK